MSEDKLNITIKIGETKLPLKINPSEEEQLRVAERIANEKYSKYKKIYTQLSEQKVLAMTIIDLARINIDLQEKKENSVIFTELSDIVVTLGDYLKAQ
ncbi:MAG: cell division protein ZapA [Bacteroidota bacterium]|nr:cell division protein ZapA [Bacteroidota bacterium]